MIELYRIITGKYDKDACVKIKSVTYPQTPWIGPLQVLILEPGNKFTIFQEHVSYNLRKFFFQ